MRRDQVPAGICITGLKRRGDGVRERDRERGVGWMRGWRDDWRRAVTITWFTCTAIKFTALLTKLITITTSTTNTITTTTTTTVMGQEYPLFSILCVVHIHYLAIWVLCRMEEEGKRISLQHPSWCLFPQYKLQPVVYACGKMSVPPVVNLTVNYTNKEQQPQ